ncbi:MAG: DUF1232 domain-containing protein, partial [Sphaerochaetaceae bacterium]|nr:DUF1232 domain-containing protein [Sphaerochaetaceae bacterium]
MKKIREKANEIKENLPVVYLAFKGGDIPLRAKVFAIFALVYALSPIDLIPDFIPFIGYLDDLIVLPFLILLTIKAIPKETIEKYKEQAKDLWKEGPPKRWFYGI